MPWVRLHAVKDYLDMLMILEKFPKIKLNFNLVPLLLDSIDEYVYQDAHDVHSKLTVTPIEELSQSDKEFILNNFFDANYTHMILPHERYAELYKKRYGSEDTNIYIFDNQEYTDLMVYFNLCWIDPMWQEKYEEVKYLLAKGRNYTFEDRQLVIKIHREIMREIIPSYKRMQEEGRVEISTSPYYHPIMPVLIDVNCAKQATSIVNFPENIPSMKKDLEIQIVKALDKFENIFGVRPRGIWPSEQSVSQPTFDLLADLGVKWSISDEGILSSSIGKEFIRDFRGYLEDPYNLCQVYEYRHDDKKINLLFRDSVLPNLLSFEYPAHNPIMAANDFYERIKAVQDKLVNAPSEHDLFTIAMDGENCWENYTNDGSTFLNVIYKLIENDDTIETVLVSDYIDTLNKQIQLREIAAGSWINRSFQLWIGEPTKNLAWEHLNKTRQDLIGFEHEFHDRQDLLEQAWREIYIAEGSDWYWWYGEPNDSGQDHVFDYLFRSHLKNVYVILNKAVPEYLDIPLINIINNISRIPKKTISPSLDGKMSDGEWDYAGCINIPTGPVLEMTKLYHKVCYGYDDENLYLKFEVNKLIFDEYIMNTNTEFYIYMQNEDLMRYCSGVLATPTRADNISPILKNRFTHSVRLCFDKDVKKPAKMAYATEEGLWIVQLSTKVLYAYDEVIEVKIPFDEIGVKKGGKIRFLVINGHEGIAEDYYPKDDLFTTYRPE